MPRVLETYVRGLVLRVPGHHVLRADNDGIIGNNPRKRYRVQFSFYFILQRTLCVYSMPNSLRKRSMRLR